MTNRIQPILDELLDCLCTTVATLDNPPAQCCLRDGTEVPADVLPEDVCCEGLAWVRPDLMRPSSQSFPDQDTAGGGCVGATWALDVELGIFRCSGAQTCAEWTTQTQQAVEDRWALMQVTCCFDKRLKQNFPAYTFISGVGGPLETQGNCGGSVLNLTLMIPGPCCV